MVKMPCWDGAGMEALPWEQTMGPPSIAAWSLWLPLLSHNL